MRRPPPSRAYIDSTALLFSVALLFYPTPVTPECPDEAGSTYATVRKYAVGLHGQGLLQAAKGCHERSAELDKTRPEPWLSIGDILRQEGYLHEAEKSIRRCIKIAPSWHLARFNLGNTLKGLGRHEDAIEEYREAMKLDPPFKAAVLNNMAISHGALNHNDDVLKCYEEALVHDPSFPETYNNMASHLQAVGRLDDAIEAFKSAVGLRPDSGFMVNLAYALGMKGDTGSAIQVYARTTELHPNYPLAYYNLGTTLMGEERYSESEWSFRMAVSLDPKVADYHNNLATVVGASGARPEVLSLYATVLGLAPGHETAYSNLHHARRELCDWVGGEEGHLGKVLDIVDRQIAEGRTPTIRPFHALAYDVDVEWARKLAEVWSDQTMTEARRMVPPGFTFPLAKLVPDTRVRIAYTSSDIKKQHPVGHLVLSLFHLHDMMSHQVICVALTPSDGSELRTEVESKVEVFVDLSEALSRGVPAAAHALNQLQPHVLVNLNGYTNGGRLEIFALRPAPLQVNAIGYPGTLGASFIDSIVTDRVTSPPEAISAYTERMIFMPNAYLVNGLKASFPDVVPMSERGEGEEALEEALEASQDVANLGEEVEPEAGLFHGKVALACFNTLIKITPRVMEAWARIVERTPNAVIWLIRANEYAVENIQTYWEQTLGMPEERLVFTGPASKDAHIRRSRHAALFMDTEVYGAHSTGTDALWSGVPIIVPAPGMSFASRVASSLLHNVGLQHLIPRSWAEYEDITTVLALSPEKMDRLHKKLRHSRWNSPLFDARGWVADFERSLRMTLESMQSRRKGSKLPHTVVAGL